LGVRSAFLWLFIRSSESLKLRHPQLSRSGPNGQPPESSHLAGCEPVGYRYAAPVYADGPYGVGYYGGGYVVPADDYDGGLCSCNGGLCRCADP
jgi:hypothetical protein